MKSSCTCSVATVSLRLGVSPGYWGLFWAKNGCFLAQNCADLGGHLPTWRPRPGPPPVSFWLKAWIWQGHHLGSRMAKVESSLRRWLWPKRNGDLFACLLVVACCLLARFRGSGGEYSNIYPLIYIPLPNSRWLHHTALSYVRRGPLGAYKWQKGPNSVKTGSKLAEFTRLCTPNGLGSLLEKCVFDPLYTHFYTPKTAPFQGIWGFSVGQIASPWAQKGLKTLV